MGLIKTFKVRANPVINGVVAGGRDKYAIAIEKTNGNILLDKGNTKFLSQLPLVFIRGIIALYESGVLLCKNLFYSADYFDKEEKGADETEILSREEWLNKQDRIKAESSQEWLVFSGVLVLMLLAILGFFILPVFISSMFFNNVTEGEWLLFNTVECIVRIVFLLIGFIVFRVSGGFFAKIRQYTCAINKVLNSFEKGEELSLTNVKNSSKFHPRSVFFILFLAIVICSIALIFIKMDNLFVALLIKLGVFILSVNVAYEISRLFGMFNGGFSRVLAILCGMWIENFIVSEPNDIQLYVAMTAISNSMIEE